MERIPSVKALVNAFPHIDVEVANKLRQIMLKPTLHMNAINRLIGGFGVETLTPPDANDDLSGDYPSIEYVNMGETYNATIAYVYNPCSAGWRTGFKIICLGDVLENDRISKIFTENNRN